MTPLFPSDVTPITIIQGQTGDCYLLTAIDCILNSGNEGLQLVKSLFTETEDGVYLRIKRTEIHATSNNFNPDKMKDKYIHHFDPLTNEDVFFMDKARLKAIDDARGGVQTNALALKILERISSYYYTSEWSNEDLLASIVAHNIRARHSTSSTEFVGKFIGVEAHDTRNLGEIIKLKIINPAQPVYISMSYGRPDQYGIIHSRHALRIDRVIKKSDGTYDFVLINPHNNTKREIFKLDDIKKRNYRFSVYNTNAQNHELTKVLLICPTAVGHYVFQNPQLHQLLINQQARGPLNKDIVNYFYNVYRSIPYFESLLNKLSSDDVNTLLDSILLSQGDKDKFINLFIQMIPRLELLSIIYTRDSSLDFKAIAQLIGDRSSEPLVRQELKNPEFLKRVIDVACREKCQETGCTLAQARNLIEVGLVQHYFKPSDNALSRSGGLRTLFYKQLLNQEDILHLFGSNKLFEKAVFAYIYMNGRVDETLVDALRLMDPSIIDDQFLNELLQDLDYKNPQQLFDAFFALSTVNPALAKTLSTMASARIEELFKISLEDFNALLNAQPDTDFHRWFCSTQAPMDEKRALRIIDGWIKRISEFPFDFDSCHSTQDIEHQIHLLVRQVEELIVAKPELEEAIHILGNTDGYHPGLKHALEHKIQQIRNAGALKAEVLTADIRVIESYINAINGYSISFKEVTQEQDVAPYLQALQAGLDRLVYRKDDLATAKLYLGLFHPIVMQFGEALEQKENEMQRLAQERYQYFASAKQSIANQVDRINAFQIYFAPGQTSKELVRTTDLLLKALDDCAAPTDELQRAQHVLGISGEVHPEIKKALEDKRQAIYSAAAKEKKIQYSLEIISRYEQKINVLAVSFGQLKNEKDVAQAVGAYLNQLTAIIQHTSDLQTARETLGYLGRHHPRIQLALDKKKQEIHQCANQRLDDLRKANEVIRSCAQHIRGLPVEFSGINSLEGVDNHAKSILARLDEITQNRADLVAAHQTLGLSQIHHVIVDAEKGKRETVVASADHAKEQINSYLDAQKILVQMNFSEHLEKIRSLKERLEEVAKTNKNYESAAQKAAVFYTRIEYAKQGFLNSGLPIQLNLKDFQRECVDAVSDALIVLSVHRGWKQTLVNFLSDALSVLSLGVANLMTGQARFFKTKTQSEVVIQDFSETISSIKVGGGT